MNFLAECRNCVLFAYYKVCRRNVPGADHVARYLKPTACDNGTATSSGFQYKKGTDGKPNEREISVNWLEFFNKEAPIQDNLEKVREAFLEKQYGLRKNGRFAVLNIGEMCDKVEEGTAEHTELVSLMVKHTPFKDDLSHSSIFGMPSDVEGEFLVSAILANCANGTGLFPAVN